MQLIINNYKWLQGILCLFSLLSGSVLANTDGFIMRQTMALDSDVMVVVTKRCQDELLKQGDPCLVTIQLTKNDKVLGSHQFTSYENGHILIKLIDTHNLSHVNKLFIVEIAGEFGGTKVIRSFLEWTGKELVMIDQFTDVVDIVGSSGTHLLFIDDIEFKDIVIKQTYAEHEQANDLVVTDYKNTLYQWHGNKFNLLETEK